MIRAFTCVVIACASVMTIGCSIEINGDSPDNQTSVDVNASRSQLEQIIEDQLPPKVKQMTGIFGYVKNVTCVSSGEGSFDCVAKVETSDGNAKYITRPYAIEGTCDTEACTWRLQ